MCFKGKFASYILVVFNIYVAMCLFDVVVALDVKKMKKNWLLTYFCILLKFPDIFPYIADKLYSGPLRKYLLTIYM